MCYESWITNAVITNTVITNAVITNAVITNAAIINEVISSADISHLNMHLMLAVSTLTNASSPMPSLLPL
jgi:hypothetical protein